uniref:E3 ubiquitin-protein ligase BRE1A-like n=1 Tax=Myxine glutinosa TaxID=7769 RepID=UPI00358F6FBB
MSGPGMKRQAGDPASASAICPPEKKPNLGGGDRVTSLMESIKLGGVASLEEMDMKVLQFRNRKLVERLEQRQAIEDELRERIEKLEKRQVTDDATLLIVNRHWAQLDENIQLLLRRLDGAMDSGGLSSQGPTGGEERERERGERGGSESRMSEGESESESQGESRDRGRTSDAAVSFLATLASSSSEEMELLLNERTKGSKEAASRLVSSIEAASHRMHFISASLNSQDNCKLQEGVLELNRELLAENGRLQEMTTYLHSRHHKMAMEYSVMQDRVTAAETKVSELETTVEDLQWEAEKLRRREQKLSKHLVEAMERVNSGVGVTSSYSNVHGGQITLNLQKFESLTAELEENKELANGRLAELEKLQQELQESVREGQKLKLELRSLPEEVVKETPEYRCLQSQFSVLYGESLQLKTQLGEARSLLSSNKNTQLRQIEHMESDELQLQKKLRTEVIQLEDALAQVRKEYEMLRIEFEQNLAANEQAGPINREMRHLISSLQNHNHQLKGEVLRYKRKLREAMSDLSKLKAQNAATASHGGSAPSQQNTHHPTEDTRKIEPSTAGTSEGALPGKREAAEDTTPSVTQQSSHHSHAPSGGKREKGSDASGHTGMEEEKEKEKERDRDREKDKDKDKEKERDKGSSTRDEDVKKKEADTVKQLRAELKKSQESQKELRLLLDMYKAVPKEQRDRVAFMAAERRTKAELEELRGRIKELEENSRRETKRVAEEDAVRRIRGAEETIEHLQKKLAATKQEEEALLAEMDVTGQAFEDMQEQNIRLLQQLREKDDANFKLMSERIKANQIHKLLREEKDELSDQVSTLKTQVEAELAVVRRLEEKERLLQSSALTLEKELSLRSHALELHKRKAVEAAQQAEELRVGLDHSQGRMREAQVSAADTRAAREKESFNLKRAQEDISKLRRKVEKQKKVEVFANADEILMEEIKEYKAKLTCPCCNARKKDAVLMKCFHVFCFECVKTRYDTRQRKCPKCNAAFGANDFHRIYIG